MSQWDSIVKIAAGVRSGEIKAAELVERALKLIEDSKDYQAVLATTHERARQRAAEIDRQASKGEDPGSLAGVPFLAKDLFLAYGAKTTAGSNILKNFDAPYQATVIERLEAAGAICVGKANLDAFGHGSSSENSDFMVTKNPHDKTRVAGGSSGGSAAAVALGLVPFALGTDTGGSTRQPASFCGVVGYKPTYGLISRYGVIAMASSTDTTGVLANSVEDVAAVIDVVAGKDERDGVTIERDETPYTALPDDIKGKQVGVIKEYMGDGVSEGVKARIETAVEQLKAAGANVKEVSLPSLNLSLAVYYIVVPAEISSNLSRYDGQRYGFSDAEAKNLDESYTLSRSEGFGSEAKRRIMIGTYVLSSGYYDAYYRKAQIVRTKLIEEFKQAFQEIDFLVGPAAPSTAFRIGQKADNPLEMYLSDAMVVGVNLAGLPGMVIPAGSHEDLPVGLQIIASQKHDRELLGFARAAAKTLKRTQNQTERSKK